MKYDLLIRQSYHGTGGKDGYRYKVYNSKKMKLGELAYIPSTCEIGDLVIVNYKLYLISNMYDSDKPMDKNSEVVFYELQLFNPEPDHDLGRII